MSSWARVGVKVVCVDDAWPENSWYGYEVLPVKGQAYTIRDLVEYEGTLCCLLVEVQNSPQDYNQGMIEAAFAVRRFRPLITQEDDVAMFRELLNVADKKVEEDV